MEQANDESRELQLLRLKETRLKAKLRQFEALLWAKERDLFTETRVTEIKAELEKLNEQIAKIL